MEALFPRESSATAWRSSSEVPSNTRWSKTWATVCWRYPTYPVYDSLPIAKTYVGVKGALSLAEDYIHLVRKMNKTKGVTFEISEFAAGINTIDAITTGQLDIGNFADYAGINRIA